MGWYPALFAIPLLSFCGRPLQLSITKNFSRESLILSLGLLFSAAILVYGVVLIRAGANTNLFHLLWVGPLALLFYMHLPFVEKLHIGIFGLFGFLTQMRFKQGVAAFLCVAVSFLDELLQHFLAARVGDWRDVWLNLFSASLGMFLALLLFESGCRQSVRESADNE